MIILAVWTGLDAGFQLIVAISKDRRQIGPTAMRRLGVGKLLKLCTEVVGDLRLLLQSGSKLQVLLFKLFVLRKNRFIVLLQLSL